MKKFLAIISLLALAAPSHAQWISSMGDNCKIQGQDSSGEKFSYSKYLVKREYKTSYLIAQKGDLTCLEINEHKSTERNVLDERDAIYKSSELAKFNKGVKRSLPLSGDNKANLAQLEKRCDFSELNDVRKVISDVDATFSKVVLGRTDQATLKDAIKNAECVILNDRVFLEPVSDELQAQLVKTKIIFENIIFQSNEKRNYLINLNSSILGGIGLEVSTKKD